MGQLTDIQIRNWLKAGAAVSKSDGDGLTFTLSAKGTAAWVLRYRVPGAKSQKEMTLGRYPDGLDNNELADWLVDFVPTPGAANTAPIEREPCPTSLGCGDCW